MNSLYNINNENLGYVVSSYGPFVAIGNPNTKQYDEDEGFSRVGEVLLYYKNQNDDVYSLLTTFKKPYLESLFSIDDYAPVDLAYNFDSGSYNHNSYGKSIDLSSRNIAIGDSNFLQKFYYFENPGDAIASTSSIQLSSVEIYKFSTTSSITNCNLKSDESYEISNLPVYSITASVDEQFGYSVSISDSYLLVGSPGYNNNSGSVYLYERNSDDSYSLITNITSSSNDYVRFGSVISFDKLKEDKFIVGSDSYPNDRVFIYKKIGDNWSLYQTLLKDTSSNYLKIQNSDFEFYPISQSNSKYGYSVDIEDNLAVVGDPKDLIYYEFSGSNKIRERGSFYIYDIEQCDPDSNYKLLTKSYGTTSIFKDNMLGFDVSIKNKKIAISSPKPYFPFSSLYLSSSIGSYTKFLEKGNLGAASYNGQILLYEYDAGYIKSLTDYPVSYRKDKNEPYSAFGHSISLSEYNLTVGSPVPVNDDLYLNSPILIEQSEDAPTECSDLQTEVFCIITEETILNESGVPVTASLVMDIPEIEEFTGRSFIYDFSNLQKNYIVGNIFYNNAKIIINNSGSMTKNILRDPSDTELPYVYMDYNSDVSFNECQYICTIEPGEFNTSTNPSAVEYESFEWNVYNREKFDFKNLDIILRYLNSRMTFDNSENWYNSFVSSNEDSIHTFYIEKEINYFDNRLTNELKCTLSNLDLDINGDGTVNILDGCLLWKYFIGKLTIDNFRDYITPKSKRKNFDEIISYLNEKTGKNTKVITKSEFFKFKEYSENDPTGSYLAPFITQVGLYDGTDLVATAKLAHPIKNTGEIPINIIIKWDI